MPTGIYQHKPRLKEIKDKIRETMKRKGLKPPRMVGENHSQWKGGLPLCKECGEKLSQRRSKLNKCRKCYLKNMKGEKHPNFKGGKPKCIDCKKEITYGFQHCKSCSAKKGEGYERFLEMIKTRKWSQEERDKISQRMSGENHPCWIKDRSKIIGIQDRNNPEYKQWRMKVWRRDNYKCKINNKDCFGKIIAHHILSWRDYPELRYEVNNGITLCQAHHPRKRAEEKRLIPFFTGLVPVSSEIFGR